MFNNLNLFCFPTGAAYTYESMSTALARRPARACGPLETLTIGFQSLYGENDSRLLIPIFSDAEIYGFCAAGEEKTIIKPALTKKVREATQLFAQTKGRPPTKPEQQEILQTVTTEMLTGTIARPFWIECMIDFTEGWLVVGTLSGGRCEAIVSSIRDALTSFPARLVAPKHAPQSVLTEWLKARKAPEPFALGVDCDLVHPERSERKWAGRATDLEGMEVQTHLEEGMVAVRLGLEMADTRFSIDNNMRLRGLKVETESDSTSEEENPQVAAFMVLAQAVVSLLPFIETYFDITRPVEVSMDDSAAQASMAMTEDAMRAAYAGGYNSASTVDEPDLISM